MYILFSIRLKEFCFDDEGSFAVETAMILPMLTWAYVAMFVYFDAFRTQNINLKAAYTISDMLSRETEVVDLNYLNGLNKVYDYLTHTRHDTWIRVSTIRCEDRCDQADPKLRVIKSMATKSQPVLPEKVDYLRDRIPTMPQSDSIIYVETRMGYEPAFNVGLKARWMEDYIVTRPRFTSPLQLGS